MPADILKKMQNSRFAAPSIIVEKMCTGVLALWGGDGMYKWTGIDQETFKRQKLRKFVDLLNMNSALKPPVL